MTNERQVALSRRELKELEGRVDAWRARIAVPQWPRRYATYLLLAVIEDIYRLKAVAVKAGELKIEQYDAWIDAAKYMLKYALEHVEHSPEKVLRVRPHVGQEEWRRASELLAVHRHWDLAVAAFTSAYNGGTYCLPVAKNRYAFRKTGAFQRQANDYLESRTVSVWSPDTVVNAYLAANTRDLPHALRECCTRMRRNNDKRPRLTDAVLDEVDALLGEQRPVLPASWSSRFGTARELARSFRNLWTAGIAHVLAVTNSHIPGKPVSTDAVLGEQTADWLTRVISRNGGIAPEAARQLVVLVTYGHGVDRPDPALQFFFALRPGLFAIPWFMYLTSNAQRNLLTLMARTHPDEFHAASSAFEVTMTNELRDVLRERSWVALFNRTLPGEMAAGEVDSILIDPTCHTVLVVELRWFLEPSESREVAEREKAGREKADKAMRKRAAVERGLRALLKEANVPDDGEWKIDAVAVFDNYLPTPPDAVDVPFISHRAFLSGMLQFARLDELVAWVRRGDWLPRLGEHFVETAEPAEYGEIHIDVDGMNFTDEGFMFMFERDRALLERWKLVPAELTTLTRRRP